MGIWIHLLPFVTFKGLVGFFNFRGVGIPVITIGGNKIPVGQKARLIIVSDSQNVLTAIAVSEVLSSVHSAPRPLSQEENKYFILDKETLYSVLSVESIGGVS